MLNRNYQVLMEYWTKKRIPYVFDETLSLYQLVRLVIKHLNETIKDQNELKDAIIIFLDIFDTNLQQQIENKFEDLKETGELETLINTVLLERKLDKEVFNVFKIQTNAYLDSKVSTSLFTTQLDLKASNERVDNIIATPTTVSEQEIIDSRQGKVSLGENLTEIKENVLKQTNKIKDLNNDYERNIKEYLTITPNINEWVYGSPVANTDEINTANQLRRVYVMPVVKDAEYKLEYNNQYFENRITLYNASGALLKTVGYVKDTTTFKANEINGQQITKAIILLKRVDDDSSALDEKDLKHLDIDIFVKRKPNIIDTTKEYQDITPHYTDWKLGSWTSGELVVNNYRAYVDILIVDKQKTKIVIPNTDWQVGYYVLSADKEIISSAFGYETTTFVINETEQLKGKTPYYLRLQLKPNPDTTINEALLKTLDVKVQRENNLSLPVLKQRLDNIQAPLQSYLKIASYNVGSWFDGSTRVPPNKVDLQMARWKKFYGKYDLDIVMHQEYEYYFDTAETIKARDFVTNHKYPYNTTDIMNWYVNTSKVPMTEVERIRLSVGGRSVLKSYITWNNKKICLLNTHLSFEEDPEVQRKADIQTLIDIMNTEPYVVLGGDFNTYTKDEFDVFINAGYTMANGGVFGWFDTHHHMGQGGGTWPNLAKDNIIVSSNIKIQNVIVDDTQPSDHAPIIVELRID